MTLHQIRYFLVLAQELHFWKTSEKVHLSQSSLSRQIQALEDELGVTLFERDKRNVKLTEAGHFLKEQWHQLIDEFDRVHLQAKKIHDGATGNISITYPGSIAYNYLPELLNTFSECMPEVKIELMEPKDEDHEHLLLNYLVDISFSRDLINNPSIQSEKLYTEQVCIVVPKNHWLTEENFQGIKDIEAERFILSGLHHTTFFASLLRQIFTNAGIEPNIHIESDFGGMILNLVSKGLGISILPYSFKEASNSQVRFIPLTEEVDLYINWRKNDQSKVLNKVITKSIELASTFNSLQKND
ncbi:LysR substrate-binding domain-containing protein [Limibacter armeniacum]|uniref:LysR family transcriptional regulator n=1 Tax=Limibacter armeniacum TaxID=466084 RepID=UPI002FE63C8D